MSRKMPNPDMFVTDQFLLVEFPVGAVLYLVRGTNKGGALQALVDKGIGEATERITFLKVRALLGGDGHPVEHIEIPREVLTHKEV